MNRAFAAFPKCYMMDKEDGYNTSDLSDDLATLINHAAEKHGLGDEELEQTLIRMAASVAANRGVTQEQFLKSVPETVDEMKTGKHGDYRLGWGEVDDSSHAAAMDNAYC